MILAIALSATLLALIGTAINLYLLRVDAGRTRVEEAQLARNILAMIADDVRAAAIYQPQDTSAIAQLIATSRSQDNDSDGNQNDSLTGGTSGTGSAGSATSIAGAGSSSQNDEDSGDSSSESDSDEQTGGTLPLGLSGTLAELYIDVTRLPRREELFSTITGYTNAPMPIPQGNPTSEATATISPPSEVKTVHYFLRQGEKIDPASLATTNLAPELQLRAAGLVRQEIARPMRTFAEQSGNSQLLESGQTLIAPEVVHLEFRYYDGQTISDAWDMREERALPVAIEVRIWLNAPDATTDQISSSDRATLMAAAREYRQTVYPPMSSAADAGTSNDQSAD
jgi:hypothetical protein